MKILVTGANGYLGKKVIRCLCDLGNTVIATDLNNDGIDARAKFIEANIFDNLDNFYELFEKPEVCLHLAWRDGFVHNSDKHMLDLSFHYRFITSLIKSGLKQVACMGTMHEVGYFEGCINENTPCNPMSLYGVSKNSLRKSVEIYCKEHGCIFQWLRAFYIFGDDSVGNSIFCKLRKAESEGKTKFPFTSGKNMYDFIHIDQIAKQISKSVSQKEINGIINVCSGKPVSLADQVEWYIKHYELKIKLEYGAFPERPYDSPCIYGDNSKISKIMRG